MGLGFTDAKDTIGKIGLGNSFTNREAVYLPRSVQPGSWTEDLASVRGSVSAATVRSKFHQHQLITKGLDEKGHYHLNLERFFLLA